MGCYADVFQSEDGTGNSVRFSDGEDAEISAKGATGTFNSIAVTGKGNVTVTAGGKMHVIQGELRTTVHKIAGITRVAISQDDK